MIALAPHQIEAVQRLRALLASRRGAILADDVGLGKSHVAAEIARASRAEVQLIVPAALIEQWRETLAMAEARVAIVTHDSLLSDPRLPDPSRERLLIVDEAHAFRNPATQRWAALARRSIAAELLLVTATPLCNSMDDLHALVMLIAADDAVRECGVASIEEAFRRRDVVEVRRIVEALVVRRERDVLPEILQFGGLHRSVIRHPVPHAAIDALAFPLLAGPHHALLRRFLWRRLESSPAALLESLRRQARFYERALDCLATGRTLSKADYRRVFGAAEDREALQQVLFWDLFAPQGEGDAAAIEAELSRLTALRDEVSAAADEKRALLQAMLAVTEPALIFTSAAATARDLFDHLARAGLLTARQTLTRDALQQFQAGRLDVLVCTDLASEGLNLQRAGVVVHYDIPWNPVKLDQRNGRAHRIGQRRAEVRAIYFLPEVDRTGILDIVFAKNRARKRVLRAAAEPASLSLLPPHLPRDAPAMVLLRALREHGLDPPERLVRRHRAGIERLMLEMSREYLDEHRLGELIALIDAER